MNQFKRKDPKHSPVDRYMCMKLRSTAAKHKERQNTLQAQRLERLNALSVRSKVESKTGLRLYDGYDLVLSINVMVGF